MKNDITNLCDTSEKIAKDIVTSLERVQKDIYHLTVCLEELRDADDGFYGKDSDYVFAVMDDIGTLLDRAKAKAKPLISNIEDLIDLNEDILAAEDIQGDF